MEFKFNVPGSKRKELAKEIGSWLAVDVKYMGAPSFAYEVGNVRIEKDGTTTFPQVNNAEVTERLLEHLYEAGFESEMLPDEETEITEAEQQTENAGLTIDIPHNNVKGNNLMKLLEVKGDLIKEALGIYDIVIPFSEAPVSFRWFGNIEPNDVKAYTDFVTTLCAFTKKATRVNATEPKIENKKYAFRCFLLRLGFIGKEYKETRKILLRNLEGSSAFKNGKKCEVTDNG